MKVKLTNVVLSFADLFKPKSFEDGGDPKFSGNFIMTDETQIIVNKKAMSLDKLLKECDKLFCEKMGLSAVPKTGYDNWAINQADGSTTRNAYVNPKTDEYYAGTDEDTMYFSASKKAEDCKNGILLVVNQLKKPVTAQDDEVYSGCLVNVVIDIFAYKSAKNKGVTASLEGVQKVADGERLGITKVDALEDFDELEADDDFLDDEDEDEEEDAPPKKASAAKKAALIKKEKSKFVPADDDDEDEDGDETDEDFE